MRSVLTAFVIAAAALVASCGGGGATAPSEELSVTFDYASTVRQLSAAESSQVSTVSPQEYEAPSSINLNAGDVTIVNGFAVKVVSVTPAPSPSRVRFVTAAPSLGEVYSHLIFDGPATAFTQSSSRSTALADRHAAAAPQCFATTDVLGLWGVKCPVAIDLGAAASVEGSLAVGASANFKRWDAITNAGEGFVSVTIDGTAALKLKGETPSGLVPGDFCHTTRPTFLGTRAKLGSPPVFTAGIGTITIPICLFADAKIGVVGTIYRMSDKTKIDIHLGSGQPPTVTKSPATSNSSPAISSDTWTVSSQSVQNDPVSVAVSATGQLGVEVGVEISTPGVIGVGVVNSLIGNAEISGTVSPVVFSIGSSLADAELSPLYCLSTKVSLSYELTYFADVPAFKLFLDTSTFSRKGFEAKDFVKTPPIDIGKCDFTVKSSTTLTVTPSPATAQSPVTLSVAVKKDDPAAGTLYDGRTPAGTVEIRNVGDGSILCRVALDASSGAGSCQATFATAASYSLKAAYPGDKLRFKESSVNQTLVVGSAPGSYKYTTPPPWSTEGIGTTGDWATVKAYSETVVNAYNTKHGVPSSCTWTGAEPNPPSTVTRNWGGTSSIGPCTGQFTVEWVPPT